MTDGRGEVTIEVGHQLHLRPHLGFTAEQQLRLSYTQHGRARTLGVGTSPCAAIVLRYLSAGLFRRYHLVAEGCSGCRTDISRRTAADCRHNLERLCTGGEPGLRLSSGTATFPQLVLHHVRSCFSRLTTWLFPGNQEASIVPESFRPTDV